MLSKEFLEEEYIHKNKSAKQIAKELGYKSTSSIHRKLLEYKIEKKNNKVDKILSRDILEELYCKQKLTYKEIREKLGIKSNTSLLVKIREYGLSRNRIKRFRRTWKGYKDISGKYFYTLKFRAKNRELDFNLDPEYLWNVFVQQDKKCIYTKIQLEFAQETTKEGMTKQTASLDRIDSNKGYIIGNVQWVHKIINKMKQDLDSNTFITFCNLVSRSNDCNIH